MTAVRKKNTQDSGMYEQLETHSHANQVQQSRKVMEI